MCNIHVHVRLGKGRVVAVVVRVGGVHVVVGGLLVACKFL